MFSKAKNPHRVFVGAVQQLLNVTEACWRPGKPNCLLWIDRDSSREVADNLLHTCCSSFWLQSAGLKRGSHIRGNIMPFRTRAAPCTRTEGDAGCDPQEMSRNDRSAASLHWASYEILRVTCRHEVGLADSHHHSAVLRCERPHAGALAGGHAVPQ
jgi:hypothetical protein